jgi:transposase
VLPARVRKPRDKAKVEAAVLVVERWILTRLRHRRFFALAELNAATAELVAALNERPMRRLGVSRRRVGLDYHVDIDGHYYSVPHRLLKEPVEARITQRTVEIFHKGERVAAHSRGGAKGRHTTVPEHMPSSHQAYAGWTLERIKREAAAIGASTAMLVDSVVAARLSSAVRITRRALHEMGSVRVAAPAE